MRAQFRTFRVPLKLGPSGTIRRKSRCFALWLALLAMLCEGVMPIYGMAFAAGNDDFAAICHASGLVQLPPDISGGAGSPAYPDRVSQYSCPFCLVLAAHFVEPQRIALSVRWTTLVETISPPEEHIGRLAVSCTPLQIRAPPATV